MSGSFFDATPPRMPDQPPVVTQEKQPDSARRWLAWYSIPVPLIMTAMSANFDAFIFVALAAGWACILFSRPHKAALRWIFAIVYPFVMLPTLGLLGFLMSDKPMRLF
jgi:hypothetical protein